MKPMVCTGKSLRDSEACTWASFHALVIFYRREGGSSYWSGRIREALEIKVSDRIILMNTESSISLYHLMTVSTMHGFYSFVQ